MGRRSLVVKYDEILNFWMRSPVKFIKFLLEGGDEFISGMLSIKFHL